MINEYHSKNNEIAGIVLDCLEAFSKTDRGRELLKDCGVNHLVIRGSSCSLREESQFFTRAVGDIDSRINSTSPSGKISSKTPAIMTQFVTEALQDSPYTANVRSENMPSDNFIHAIKRGVRKRFFPKLALEITPRDPPTDESIPTIKMDINYYDTVSRYPLSDWRGEYIITSPKGDDFLCQDDICYRLASKIMALLNTKRYKEGSDEVRTRRRVTDMIDAYELFHRALEKTGTKEELFGELRKIYDEPFYAQHNLRWWAEFANGLTQGHLQGTIAYENTDKELSGMIDDELKRLQNEGLIEIHKDFDANEVAQCCRELGKTMEHPIMNLLMRLAGSGPNRLQDRD